MGFINKVCLKYKIKGSLFVNKVILSVNKNCQV